MKCLNCGEYVSSNDFFCSSCGKVNISCPKCSYIVSDEDSFCGICSYDLSETIKKAKKLQDEKNKKEAEERKRKLEEKKKEELKVEMKKYASNLIIDCEGNKFKAIKELKEKFNVDNDIATEYINEAYKIINNNEKKDEETIKNINLIKEEKYYDYASIEDNAINNSKSSNQYVNSHGIKKTIIVSQNSRKKATSAIGRGLIGSALLGPVGLLAGATAKSKETTTFQVIYNNGKQDTVTVKNGSWLFKEYCKYLDN